MAITNITFRFLQTNWHLSEPSSRTGTNYRHSEFKIMKYGRERYVKDLSNYMQGKPCAWHADLIKKPNVYSGAWRRNAPTPVVQCWTHGLFSREYTYLEIESICLPSLQFHDFERALFAENKNTQQNDNGD